MGVPGHNPANFPQDQEPVGRVIPSEGNLFAFVFASAYHVLVANVGVVGGFEGKSTASGKPGPGSNSDPRVQNSSLAWAPERCSDSDPNRRRSRPSEYPAQLFWQNVTATVPPRPLRSDPRLPGAGQRQPEEHLGRSLLFPPPLGARRLFVASQLIAQRGGLRCDRLRIL
jgi:hypothetical protein